MYDKHYPFEDPDWADYTQIVYLYLAQMENKGKCMAVDNDVKNYCSSNTSSSVQHYCGYCDSMSVQLHKYSISVCHVMTHFIWPFLNMVFN